MSWADVGAIGQIITAIMSIVVAWVAIRFARRQGAITVLTNLNMLWSAYNSCIIQNPQARSVVEKLKKPIIGSPDDYTIDMLINIYETSFLLYEDGAVKEEYYEAMMQNSIHTLSAIPRDQLQSYLSRGYHPRFVKDIMERLNKRTV
jgi:hypothetical protein